MPRKPIPEFFFDSCFQTFRPQHANVRIQPEEREDLERVARYIIRNPLPKWRELIKPVWEADPLICPTCHREMRMVSLTDERDVIEKMLKCLGLWGQGVRVDLNSHSGTDTST